MGLGTPRRCGPTRPRGNPGNWPCTSRGGQAGVPGLAAEGRVSAGTEELCHARSWLHEAPSVCRPLRKVLESTDPQPRLEDSGKW